MIINGKNTFMGAYDALRPKTDPLTMRNVDKSHMSAISDTIKSTILGNSQFQSGNVSVSISQETIDLFTSEAGYEKMVKDIDDMYTNYINRQKQIALESGSDSPFMESAGAQWMVFSEFLYNNEFYSDMEIEDVKEIEDLLKRITREMDGISSGRYGTGMVVETSHNEMGNDLSSAEARIELASSASALRYFADKYIDDEDKREKFNKLVDQYHAHNNEALEGYKGIRESFAKSLHNLWSDIYAGKYPNSPLLRGPKPKEQPYEGFQHFMKLGGIRQTEEETGKFHLTIHNMFENLRNNTDNWNSLWGQIRDTFNDFVTGNTDDKGFRSYANKESDAVFNRIGSYWKQLYGM